MKDGQKDIELLNNIQRVEAPAHLYKQILERIAVPSIVPRRWLLAACAAVLLLISVNVVLIQEVNSEEGASSNLVETMGLETNDNLYNYE